MATKLAVVQIRGTVKTHPDVRKTLELLRLKQKHACAVHENNEVVRGMLQKVKDYVTYGEIDEAMFKQLLEKRGESIGKKKIEDKKVIDEITKKYFAEEIKLRDFDAKYAVKPYFRLHPPAGGFERKGIKQPFTKGGVLGNRKESMKDLLIKML